MEEVQGDMQDQEEKYRKMVKKLSYFFKIKTLKQENQRLDSELEQSEIGHFKK